MKLLVLGATGGTGKHVVCTALAKGHDVTVFVRHPDGVTHQSDRLRLVVGSLPDDSVALASAVAGQDAVISTLGVGNSLKARNLIALSTLVIVNAMKTQGVGRLVFTSAFGVGDTYRDVPWLARVFIAILLKDIYADKAASEPLLKHSDLDWTLVYPTRLTNGAGTGSYRVGERLALKGLPSISRADVADFLVSQAADRAYVRKGVLISD